MNFTHIILLCARYHLPGRRVYAAAAAVSNGRWMALRIVGYSDAPARIVT